MNIIKKEAKIVIEFDQGEKIVIPSRLYPLESVPYIVLSEHNTEKIEDQTLINIFNSVEAKVGYCFTNMERLVRELNAAGYPAKQFVGWAFIFGDIQPIHHSIAILDNHVFDLRINTANLLKSLPLGNYNLDEKRQLVAKQYQHLNKLPNHQKCIFGTCSPNEFYVMAEGTREQGQKRNLSLRTDFVNHPAFRDVNSDGKTAMQSILLNK